MDWSGALPSDSLPLRMEIAGAWPQSVAEFEALIDRLQHRLVQFAFYRLRSREDAEDVVQEVLVQAFRDRGKHRIIDNADAFLFRMVSNRCSDLLRRRKRDGGSLEDLAWEPEAQPPDPAVAMRLIAELLDRLPARQAEAIRLRVYGELPFEAVAEAMGCSVPTVKSRFRYGIQKLRRVLE